MNAVFKRVGISSPIFRSTDIRHSDN
jgi:hypothetical protein